MKKILLGFGYFTWGIFNITIIYFLGIGVLKLTSLDNVKDFLILFSLGSFVVLLAAILSIITLHLIAIEFGDKKMEKKIDKMNLFQNF
jgi:hypothetical protein